MYPKPTQLFRRNGGTDDPLAESYWKAANGIRMSGMPAFKTKLNDTQLWQVTQLVAHANEISESVKRVLVPDVLTFTIGTRTAFGVGSRIGHKIVQSGKTSRTKTIWGTR
jgi:hypothetical protein